MDGRTGSAPDGIRPMDAMSDKKMAVLDGHGRVAHINLAINHRNLDKTMSQLQKTQLTSIRFIHLAIRQS